MSKKKQLMKNTIIIFLGKVMTQLITFFLLPIYTSYLDKDQYGLVDLIQTYVVLIVPIITLELEMSVFRFLIERRNDEKDTKKVLTNNYFVLLFGLVVFSIIYIVFTEFVYFQYRWLILIDIIVCTISGNFLQIARGFGKTIDFTISSIITGIFTVLSNIVLIILFNMKTEGMIISMVFANFLGAVYLFFKLKLYKYFSFDLIDNKLIKKMNKYSIPLIPNGISWWIVNVSDRTIISFVLGNAYNGLYAISNKFPTLMSSLLGIFNLSWSESASLHINSSDRDEFFSDVTNTTVKIFSSIGALMISFMPFIFPILINSKYNEALDYIPLLVLGSFFNVLICLYSGMYIALKMTKKVATTSVLGAVINIIINIIFIKKFGLYAAAASTAIAYFIMMIYRHIDIKKYINIKFKKTLVLNTIIIYLFVIIIYYQNNIYLNIISILLVIIYSIILNKDFLLASKNTIISKIKFKG